MQNKKFFIKTFGCIQNTAASERIKAFYCNKGYEEIDNWKRADLVVINTCIIRESAENRIYGLINEINKNDKFLISNDKKKKTKIIVTGCLAGLADKDKTGKKLAQLKRDFPEVSEFLPIEKISFKLDPIRDEKMAALITISNGCNNFCSYCIVPYAKGREKSRKFEEIIKEVDEAIKNGFKEVLLIGQNVNSYGMDLEKAFLFPELLEEVAKKDLRKISFISSNPWDFSDELIKVIAKYPNIDRLTHLPIQSGDDEILKKMNRNYTAKDYLKLVEKLKSQISDLKLSTDIIVGFPGEDEKAFQNTVELCKKVKFEIAYINKYSPRKGTVSAKLYKDDIPMSEKKKRWKVLDELINQK